MTPPSRDDPRAATMSRDPDRLVLFTDAVTAIALTLLVLPLVDVVPESAAEHHRAVEVITEHQAQIYSFLLSFVVIARLWLAHHRIFQHVRAYTLPLVLWNLGWLLAIVVLPFPTEMTGAYGDDRFTVCFYIGTILAASACQTAMTLIIRRNPAVNSESDPLSGRYVRSSVSATTILALALLLAATVPGLTYKALLLLLLDPFLVPALDRLRART